MKIDTECHSIPGLGMFFADMEDEKTINIKILRSPHYTLEENMPLRTLLRELFAGYKGKGFTTAWGWAWDEMWIYISFHFDEKVKDPEKFVESQFKLLMRRWGWLELKKELAIYMRHINKYDDEQHVRSYIEQLERDNFQECKKYDWVYLDLAEEVEETGQYFIVCNYVYDGFIVEHYRKSFFVRSYINVD